MEEKTLNERESLEIITRMIQETKNKLEVGDGNILLIWGYVWLSLSMPCFYGFKPHKSTGFGS